jgi:hypothetical protein
MLPDRTTADDVAALQRHVSGDQALPYLDLRQRNAIDGALARWPWLRSLHHRRAQADDGADGRA